MRMVDGRSAAGSQGDPGQDQRPAGQRAPMQRFAQEGPGQGGDDDERQAHEWVSQMQRGMAQDPDPRQGGGTIQDQGRQQPTVAQPIQPLRVGWQRQRSLLEQQLSEGDGEDADQSAEG